MSLKMIDNIETTKKNIGIMSKGGLTSVMVSRQIFDKWIKAEPVITRIEEYKYNGNSFIYPFGKNHVLIKAVPVRVK